MKEWKDIKIPMRDGTLLSGNVYRPDDDKPYPAILMRTPYLKEKSIYDGIYSNYEEMALSGYNMIFQDVRGTGQSDGYMDATGASEIDDGYDSIEWIAAQPWCDGNVGMQGLSYFGYTQMAAAENRPPHLKAFCPFQNSAIDPFSYTKARTFDSYHLSWILDRVTENINCWCRDEKEKERILAEIKEHKAHWDEETFQLPVIDHPAAKMKGVSQTDAFLELVKGIEDSSFLKKAHRPIRIENITAPMFFLTGWFDGACEGTLDNWQHATGCPISRKKLMIGPWLHGGNLDSKIENIDFGEENSGKGQKIQKIVKDWFDYWLKGIENGIMDEAPVFLFTLGANSWRKEQEWPLSRAVYTPYYLSAGKDKNSGKLSQNPSQKSEPQQYVYNPENPLPSFYEDQYGHRIFADPTAQQEREDVLVFCSEALTQDMEVTGPISCRLFASTTAPDTDFVCRVSDVDEEGKAFPLLSGIVRGKFRNAGETELLEPGKVYEFTIQAGNISNLFKKGHRIRMDVSSSLYPMHNRNLNTSDRIGFGTKSQQATQTIYHDSRYPSALILPVIPQ